MKTTFPSSERIRIKIKAQLLILLVVQPISSIFRNNWINTYPSNECFVGPPAPNSTLNLSDILNILMRSLFLSHKTGYSIPTNDWNTCNIFQVGYCSSRCIFFSNHVFRTSPRLSSSNLRYRERMLLFDMIHMNGKIESIIL